MIPEENELEKDKQIEQDNVPQQDAPLERADDTEQGRVQNREDLSESAEFEESQNRGSLFKFFLGSIAVIVLDQIVKLLVHFNMYRGEEIPIFGNWFKLHYTTNPGMAFGLQLGWEYGKFGLTFFRLIAVGIITYLIVQWHKKNVHPGVIWCMAIILGGAIGNVIDSTFYGVYLNNAPYGSPTRWFHGQVIDMFYFDIWQGEVASWVPIFGGEFYALWPIFNIADAAIFIGITIMLIFQKRFFERAND